MNEQYTPTIPGVTDLARESLGGTVLAASDDFFAAKENLIKDASPVFIADKYTDNGKWMDGWESRRKRVPGHDWCILRLAFPGKPVSVTIDTSHFRGNHPPYASVDACLSEEEPQWDSPLWQEILPQSPLKENSANIFAISGQPSGIFSHCRLNIFPDGGVARLRVFGTVPADREKLRARTNYNLLDFSLGARSLCCSDSFFSPMQNLILPDMPSDMGGGWETRRRRSPGHDWVILQAAAPGKAQRIELSTRHFKGNYPDTFSIEACLKPDAGMNELMHSREIWTEMLERHKAGPDQWHTFGPGQLKTTDFSHLRLKIFPDGGVARLRVFGDTLHL